MKTKPFDLQAALAPDKETDDQGVVHKVEEKSAIAEITHVKSEPRFEQGRLPWRWRDRIKEINDDTATD